jgi:hyperosmotically inducible periplasmic protein
MNGRSLTISAAVFLALAGLSGCGRDDDRVTTAPETTAPPAAPAPAPAVEAPLIPPAGTTSGTPPMGDAADRTAGQTVDDAGVTARIKAALLSESDVDGTRINVDTFNGRVTLKGEVPNQGQVDRAGQIARGADGVKDVDNRLTVTPG